MTTLNIATDPTAGWSFDGLLRREESVEGGVRLTDGRGWGEHLARIPVDDAFMRWAQLTVEIRFLSAPEDALDVSFDIIQPDLGPLLRIASDSSLVRGELCEAAELTLRDDVMVVKARFIGRTTTLLAGLRHAGGGYLGTGNTRIELTCFQMATDSAADWLAVVPDNEKLVLVDVGAAAGLQPAWLRHAQFVSPVMVEPNPTEAARLLSLMERMPGGQVIGHGLAHQPGQQILHVANWYGCTSIRRPDMERLGAYRIAPLFATVSDVTIDCTRYDLLHEVGEAPAPDVVKLDVEGFEHEVLLGFGGLLGNCLGIEAEAAYYPIYHGQRLLSDLVALLDRFGMVLRRTEPVDGFEGDQIVVNAFFTCNRTAVARLDATRRRKFNRLCTVWDLPHYPEVI